ncbi:MAG TPA: beta-ketoacyl-ACP synthase II [Acidimicrobiales bacterium]
MRSAVAADGPVAGRRVVVTGVGAVTAAGVGADVLFKALGECVAPPSALVRHFEPDAFFGVKEARRLDKFSQYTLAAAVEAFDDAKLEFADPERAGALFATGVGGISTMIEQVEVLRERGADRVSPFFIPMLMPNAGAAAVSLRFGMRGPCQTVTTACAAGTHAVTDAARLIAQGRCDVMLTGGGEHATEEIAVAGFRNMTALSRTGISRPFDVARDGFVLGEGGAALVLEELGHATARGATIYAEVLGGASTADAHHITAPDPDSAGAIACIRLALEDAQCTPGDIGHVNAHGTSTPLNDLAEARALHAVFTDGVPPVTSVKGYLGHSLGAAGAIEAVVSVLTVANGVIPPTAGTKDLDPAVDLDVVLDVPRPLDRRVVLSNSFGFGGHNGTVIFGPLN